MCNEVILLSFFMFFPRFDFYEDRFPLVSSCIILLLWNGIPYVGNANLLTAAMQIIVRIQHHHYHKELIVAIILASVAVVAIVSSTVCAWIFWQRSRKTLNSEDIESSGSVAVLVSDRITI